MIRGKPTTALIILVCVLLAGCWDKAELSEFGFAQAVAIDRTKEGQVQLATHFYLPSGGGEASGPSAPGRKGFNIVTQANTVFEAIRNIPITLGRKAKWDHNRVIIIGEEIAKYEPVQDVLDLLSRDQEPRATTNVLIAEGKADQYLQVKPFIENTIGQQLKEILEVNTRYAGKTVLSSMLDLGIQLKSETGVAVVPRIQSKKNGQEDMVAINGVYLLQDGLLKASMSPKQTESLLILRNEYQSGVIEYPCSGASGAKAEAFEVVKLNTQLHTSIHKEEIIVRVVTNVEGSIGELRCSILKNSTDELKLREIIKEDIETGMRSAIALLQDKQIDALGIGNQIYRNNPHIWKKWKPIWKKRFSNVEFQLEVNIKDMNSGLNAPSPFAK